MKYYFEFESLNLSEAHNVSVNRHAIDVSTWKAKWPYRKSDCWVDNLKACELSHTWPHIHLKREQTTPAHKTENPKGTFIQRECERSAWRWADPTVCVSVCNNGLFVVIALDTVWETSRYKEQQFLSLTCVKILSVTGLTQFADWQMQWK